MSNSVKDRSGAARRAGAGPGMLPKAERRALGKAAAAKRAAQRRRKEALNRVVRYTWPFALIAVLAGLTWWAIDSQSPATPDAQATGSPSASAAPTFSLPAGADPQLGVKPTVATPSGDLTELKVTTLIAGTGPAAANGQEITVNYVGVAFSDGKEFDASWNAGREPFSFTLGGGGVIKGWDQGLVGVTVGSRVQLDIPADLAYGTDASTGRPVGPLRFVVDVLSAAG